MQELKNEILCANSSQAKGQVERANQILQDRLVKELRLRGLSDMQPGNAYLPEFIANLNQRFAVPPRSLHDAHRPLTKLEDLAYILVWQEPRILSKNLTLQIKKAVYQIHTERPTYSLHNATVTVHEDAAGQVTIFSKATALEFIIFHKQVHQAEIVDTKELDRVLPTPTTLHKPGPNHPRRTRRLPPTGSL
jgi:hypothetical protein